MLSVKHLIMRYARRDILSHNRKSSAAAEREITATCGGIKRHRRLGYVSREAKMTFNGWAAAAVALSETASTHARAIYREKLAPSSRGMKACVKWRNFARHARRKGISQSA